ncbi:uncharacterized protein POLR1D isoform X2 [Varanus komodoensis]|uniref:uncharacterized protein POLR1D isoform X2 n=1 Tax=Varanus komodoensis TaxID=61221 RepID=UPI001CF787BB|nr:uncharacterized protein POLR1D isoform X2 [Varanus komodoensis]
MAEDSELERKAVEELLTEAKRGKTRAETMGPMGCRLMHLIHLNPEPNCVSADHLRCFPEQSGLPYKVTTTEVGPYTRLCINK